MSRCVPLLICLALATLACGSTALAERRADVLLPPTTKGYFSVPDLEELRQRWEATQFGRLMDEPAMAAFVDDLRDQLERGMTNLDSRLGIRWEDLREVASGELCVAALQPADPPRHAAALLVDVAGREPQAQQLVARVGQYLVEQRGAERVEQQVGNVPVTSYRVPPPEGQTRPGRLYYFLHDSWLVAADHPQAAHDVLARLLRRDLPTLADEPSYAAVRERVAAAVSDELPRQLEWWVEPFGYVEVLRAAAAAHRRRGTDLLRVLENQGFRAVQAVGGSVTLAEEPHDLLHRTLVYSPGAADAAGQFRLAARMLDFPNLHQLEPPAWVPADVSSYTSFHWRMREAFEYVNTLANELLDAEPDDDLFEDILVSIETDPLGPQLSIRRDLVAYFEPRAIVISSHQQPPTPQSERVLFAVELTNAERVTDTVRRAFEDDPTVVRLEYRGHVIWEIRDTEELEELPALRIDGPDFGPFGEPLDDPIEEDADRLLPARSAVTIAHGQLMVASQVGIIQQLLDAADQPALASAADYRRVSAALDQLGAQETSFRTFARTADTLRTTYELMRQGLMPQSETLLGRVLNRIYQQQQEDLPRRQEVDAQKLPPFESIEHLFGVAGSFVETRDDGWLVVGCLLPPE